MKHPIFDVVILRCTTTIDGIEYVARTSVPREDWEEAPEVMREWHRDMLRQELAAGIRDRLGVVGDHASLSVETCGPPMRPDEEQP